jgi:hypothetical protein
METLKPHAHAAARMRTVALGLAALIVATAAIPAGASETNTETIGGAGGGHYRIACGPGRFLVGLTGRSGAWIDQVAPICAKIDSRGRWAEAPWAGPAVGGSGGGPFTIQCPQDSIVVGFHGYGREYVFNLGLTCRHDGPAGAEWKTALPALVGGSLDVSSSTGGSCGAAKAADGIVGGAGIYVDRFGLLCGGYLGPLPEPVTELPPAPKPIDPVEKKRDSSVPRILEPTFFAPTINGAGVDVCLHWGVSCGAPAADEFCRMQGYAASISHTIRYDAPPTLILGDNVVCADQFCDRFDFITCR